MSRFIVPVVVVVALIGGYVVGQQPVFAPPRGNPLPPNSISQEPSTTGGWKYIGGPVGVDVENHPSRVGRYAPAGDNRMLDTMSGTLYEVHERGWRAVARLSDAATTATVSLSEDVVTDAPPTETEEPSIYELLSMQRAQAFRDVYRLLHNKPGNDELKQQLTTHQVVVAALDDLLDSALPTQKPAP